MGVRQDSSLVLLVISSQSESQKKNSNPNEKLEFLPNTTACWMQTLTLGHRKEKGELHVTEIVT